MAKKIKIELDFDIGQIVYLKTDAEQLERMVVEIRLLPGGVAIYSLSCIDTVSEHYAIEIDSEKDINKIVGEK